MSSSLPMAENPTPSIVTRALRVVEDHVSPALRRRGDGGVGFGVIGLEELQRPVREDDSETERGAARILLGDSYAHMRHQPPHENCGVESGRTGAEYLDGRIPAHRPPRAVRECTASQSSPIIPDWRRRE